MIPCAHYIRIFAFFLLSLAASTVCSSQFYDLGQDPASVKWKQIRTEHFTVICPQQFEEKGQQYAGLLEAYYEPASVSLGRKPRRISVILHNQTVISNASVPWAPKRMEVFTCPDQESYPQPWLDQVALHELRHVVQVDKVNQGFTRALYYIFGEQSTAAIVGTFVPFWFLEGDAVVVETQLSNSGRGRSPSFSMELRAQLLEKGRFSYDKAVYGSYRDYIPDHYILGYNLVAWTNKKYGSTVWERALSTVGRYPFIITPFSHGIRHATGGGKVSLYKECMRSLDSLWSQQDKMLSLTGFTKISGRKKKKYTSYRNPAWVNDSTYFAVKSGIDDVRRFVLIDRNGKEKKIFTPGDMFRTTCSYASGMCVWSENTYDARWENRTFSVIKTCQLKPRNRKQLTHRSRLFSPSLSHDGKRIAAVEVTASNEAFLVIMDAQTGDISMKINAPGSDLLMTPSWANNDKNIVMIGLEGSGKYLALAKPATGLIVPISSPVFTEISKPVMHGKWVYFVASWSGIDNIFACDTASGKMFQVTSSRFGVADPQISSNGDKLLYSDYSSDGYDIAETVLDSTLWLPFNQVKNSGVDLVNDLPGQNIPLPANDRIASKIYPSDFYGKFMHLINFHSWGPISVDAYNNRIRPGISVMSQNKLSTLFSTLGYDYDFFKTSGKFYADVSLRAWYPVFDLHGEYVYRNLVSRDSAGNETDLASDETSIQGSIRVPLNLTSGRFQRFIQPQVSTSLYTIKQNAKDDRYDFSGFFHTMEARLLAYNLLRSSYKDVQPRFGQMIELNYKHTPFGGVELGEMIALESILYFPGFFRHHSIFSYLAYQNNNRRTYKYGDIIRYPRGYKDQYMDVIYSATANYSLPLLYPDFHVGSLVYLKRISANLYLDYGVGTQNGQTSYFRSAGAEIIGDMHLLRFVSPISLGLRASYLPVTQEIVPEFLYSVNLNQIGSGRTERF